MENRRPDLSRLEPQVTGTPEASPERKNTNIALKSAGWCYSHSMVAGGFDEMSYTTRLTPFTSLMMRPEIFASSE